MNKANHTLSIRGTGSGYSAMELELDFEGAVINREIDKGGKE